PGAPPLDGRGVDHAAHVAIQVLDDRFGEVLHHQPKVLANTPADVRREYDVVQFCEWVVAWQGLHVVDVHGRAGDLTALERLHQRLLVDNGPARDVDEVARRLHQ